MNNSVESSSDQRSFGGPLRMEEVRFSRHALRRISEMNLTAHEVRMALTEPDKIFASKKYDDGSLIYRYKRIALPIDPTGVVITALWSQRERWSRNDPSTLVA